VEHHLCPIVTIGDNPSTCIQTLQLVSVLTRLVSAHVLH
jgi:hypothetical protein